MNDKKNPTAVKIGQRIKQARRMAGFDTVAQLLKLLPGWSASRVGNYEAGISSPSPDDVRVIAVATDASPCWIMFGAGPIRASGRDKQAIRHQNLVGLIDIATQKSNGLTKFLKEIGISKNKLEAYINNPFIKLPERTVRRCEKAGKHAVGWMDEQHIELDPVCAAFPDDMREVMTIYSNLDNQQKVVFLRVANAFI